MTMSLPGTASRIMRTTRCIIDSFEPSGAVSSFRNCFDRTSFDSGHSRLPDPPDNSIIFIFYVLF